MLPAVVPNPNIYYFAWNLDYVENAPVTRIQNVADVLLGAIQRLQDQVSSAANASFHYLPSHRKTVIRSP